LSVKKLTQNYWKNFSLVITCPGLDSALKSRSPPYHEGEKMIARVKNPIPPSKWVWLCQNNKPWGTASMSFRIVAPVVVYPDIISKNASVNDGIVQCIIKGIAEEAETTIHPVRAIKKPSLFFNSFFSECEKYRAPHTSGYYS